MKNEFIFLAHALWIWPLAVALMIGILHRASESTVARVARLGSIIYFAVTVIIESVWIYSGHESVEVFRSVPIHVFGTSFDFGLIFDSTSAVFIGVTAFCSVIVVRFSRTYLHREEGFARFFFMIFSLVAGMTILSLANCLVFFFVGWDILGLSSFYLVSFYRRRRRSVENALTIFAVYRFADFGLLFCLLLVNYAIGNEPSFAELMQRSTTQGIPMSFDLYTFFLGIGLLLAASAKSAQFPFCFWMPRAMEGPTPSSAIFYGALSIHSGVLLLIRMEPIWFSSDVLRYALGGIGILTAVCASEFGRVQSSIKGQLAYASIAQVGIIFLELALGWKTFALYHFAAHAFFRSFQILISPSIVADLMDLQNSDDNRVEFSRWSLEGQFGKRLQATFYTFALEEGYLEIFWRSVNGLIKRMVGHVSEFFFSFWGGGLGLSIAVLVIGGAYFGFLSRDIVGIVFAFVQVLISVSAVLDFRSARSVFNRIGISILIWSADFSYLFPKEYHLGLLMILAVLPFWIVFRFLLAKFVDERIPRFGDGYGLFVNRPVETWILVIFGLAVVCVPPGPSFFVEDALLSHVIAFSYPIAILFGLSSTFNGIALMRLLAFIGMGEPLKQSES